jgi:hypothetical protein
MNKDNFPPATQPELKDAYQAVSYFRRYPTITGLLRDNPVFNNPADLEALSNIYSKLNRLTAKELAEFAISLLNKIDSVHDLVNTDYLNYILTKG